MQLNVSLGNESPIMIDSQKVHLHILTSQLLSVRITGLNNVYC